MIKPARREIILIGKLVVTLVLVGLIVSFADWSRFLATLKAANPFLVLLVFCLMVLCVSISAWKWQSLLRIHGARFSFTRLHRWYFVAMFFNNFLPTSIGGDGYRVWRTLDNSRSRTSAVLAVLVERLSGIASLLGLGLIGALIGWFSHGHRLSGFYLVCGVVGLILAAVFLCWLIFSSGLKRLRAWPRLPQKARIVIEHFDDYARDPSAGIRAVVVISVVFHAVSLLWMSLLVRSVGDSIALTDLAVVAALISVVAVIPISINGIGVVDGSFIWLAGQYGVSYEAALGVMLLQRALLIPISLFGAWLYFRDGKDQRFNSTQKVDEALSESGRNR